MTPTVEHGDMRDVLARLAANGVRFDSCCCDPPYHLASIVKRFGAKDAAPAKSDGATGVYARSSRGFMGKEWDGGDIAFRPETWALVGSVLKPGAHLVAFAAPKNGHRLTCAIEDAGFEIRDDITELLASDSLIETFLASLSEEQAGAFLRILDESPLGGVLGKLFWMFGTGFPKSHNVANAIDLRHRKAAEGGYAWQDGPPPEVYEVTAFVREARDRLGKSNADLDALFGFNGMAGHWTSKGAQPAVPTGEQWPVVKAFLGLSDDKDALVARINDLKGSIEGTAFGAREVTGEVTEWADRSNYALTSRDGKRRDNALTELAARWKGWGTALKPAFEPIVLARWPLAGSIAANVVEHGTGALNIEACGVPTDDVISATRNVALGSSGSGVYGGAAKPGTYRQKASGRWPANVIHDGSDEVRRAFPNEVDRFFYSTKADAADRLDSKHPTVKPVGLIRWLVRLVTPAGGAVLDPFAGSGTTGMAAMAEGFRCTLVEREAEYVADIRRRIAHVSGGGTPIFAAAD
jgi:DNA modification methylase